MSMSRRNNRSKVYIYVATAAMLLFSLTSGAQRAAYGKMSAWVRQIAVEQQNARQRAGTQDGKQKTTLNDNRSRLCALMKIDGQAEQVLEKHGCRALAKIGNVYVADIPLNRLASLSADSRVLRIEARQSNRLHMDTTAALIGATNIYSSLHLPQAFTGRGVVVGVQDVGFDLTHPNFYSRDLKEYRIKTFWDMLSTDTIGSNTYVGRTYNGKEEILKYGHSRDNLLISHGTHTAGTAGGSGYNTDFRGVAWESDICLVNNAVGTDLVLIDSADVYKYTYATDVLGFKYMFDYADRMGKPCVVSFSEGSHQDLRGDDILFYEALEALSGPGHVIVASAGNEGTQTSMVPKPAGMEKAGTYIISEGKRVGVTAESTDDMYINTLLLRETGKIDTIRISTRDVFAAEDSVYADSITTADGKYIVEIHGFNSCYDKDMKAYDIIVRAPKNIGREPYVYMECEGMDVDATMYISSGYFYNYMCSRKTGNAVNGHNIHSPGSAPSVICVGATAYRERDTNYKGEMQVSNAVRPGMRAHYSSMGPTLDGRIKPDVVAPGTNIISSYSSYYIEANPEAEDLNADVSRFGFNGRMYSWNANTGTSMATPIVAGTIALWLQARPDMTGEDVMDVLRHTCDQPDPHLDYPNNEYGYGAINAYTGLLYVLGLDTTLGLDKMSTEQPQKARFALNGKKLEIVFDNENGMDSNAGTLTIYSLDGKKMISTNIDANHNEVDMSMLKSGVYAVQLQTGDTKTTGSTLIRL